MLSHVKAAKDTFGFSRIEKNAKKWSNKEIKLNLNLKKNVKVYKVYVLKVSIKIN